MQIVWGHDMSNPIIYDGEIHREMTEVEYAEWQTLVTEIEAAKQAAIAKEKARAAALAKLGLTADEIAALFG